jgi:hypothetical protein
MPAVIRNDGTHCDLVPSHIAVACGGRKTTQRLKYPSRVVSLCGHGRGQEGRVSHTWHSDRSYAGSILFEVLRGVKRHSPETCSSRSE